MANYLYKKLYHIATQIFRFLLPLIMFAQFNYPDAQKEHAQIQSIAQMNLFL